LSNCVEWSAECRAAPDAAAMIIINKNVIIKKLQEVQINVVIQHFTIANCIVLPAGKLRKFAHAEHNLFLWYLCD
jgi:hypothetical protein